MLFFSSETIEGILIFVVLLKYKDLNISSTHEGAWIHIYSSKQDSPSEKLLFTELYC